MIKRFESIDVLRSLWYLKQPSEFPRNEKRKNPTLHMHQHICIFTFTPWHYCIKLTLTNKSIEQTKKQSHELTVGCSKQVLPQRTPSPSCRWATTQLELEWSLNRQRRLRRAWQRFRYFSCSRFVYEKVKRRSTVYIFSPTLAFYRSNSEPFSVSEQNVVRQIWLHCSETWGQFNKETTSVVFLQLQSAYVNVRLITDWIQ